jgi:outer membrane protein OmpA-like peptidoglycan-associated protein
VKQLIVICLFLQSGFPVIAQAEPEHIRSIYFGGGSNYIHIYQKDKLGKFLQNLPNIEHYEITIHSHTDNIGGVDYNNWLSRMRSRAVILELLSHGIQKDFISVQDFGLFNPVYDNNIWEGRMKNRRVDILFWPVVM